MDSVLTVGREQIAMDVKSRLQTRLDTYKTGIEVVAVSIRESRPPDAVKEAFDDVVKAREDEVRLRNEASLRSLTSSSLALTTSSNASLTASGGLDSLIDTATTSIPVL